LVQDITGAVEIARQQTIGDLLRRTARRYPKKLAIRCGATAWTYAEFDQICNRLARGLTGSGLHSGDRLAVLSRNSHAFAALRFAAARAGAVLVPINFMLNAAGIAFILKSSEAKFLAFGPEFESAADAAASASAGTNIEQLIALPGEDEPASENAGLSFASLMDEDAPAVTQKIDGRSLAQIVYTSGTESLPKGAMLSHDAVIWQYVSCIVDGCMQASDRMLHALPLYHCAQLDVFLGPAIYLGMTNIITGKPQPEIILPMLERFRITSFFAPPTIWISLLRSPLLAKSDLGALEKGYYGASIMPVEVLKELQTRLPKVRLWNLYGQTEIAPLATVLQPEDQLSRPGSAGLPVLNVETRVVLDDMQDAAPGEIGEIVHRSPHLMMGYYKDAARTAEAFAGGWFHSGDLATADAEGYITVVDRKKDMIKTGGENVSSREVEEALYLLPEISEAAVVGLPDPLWIEAVTAAVVMKGDQVLDEEKVLAHARQHLAPFKVPKRVVFLDALPKNPSGKLLKRLLREQLGGGSSETHKGAV
jgi:fatty-acyl-CoA synthase